MHILNKSEKVKLNWIFHNEFIYSFLFFFFCNKAKRENDIWTNELAEYYLTLLKENNNKKKKNTDPQFFQRYFSLLSNDISNLIKCSLSNNIFKSNYFF